MQLDYTAPVTSGSAMCSSGRVIPSYKPWQLRLKRVIDVTVSAALLLLLSPVFVAISVLIKITSEGSALFIQNRVGANGVEFKMLKFRTMYQASCTDQPLFDDNNELLKREHDPRITGLGRWLRRRSLDELPQLINVLRGEMSLVGPRPLPRCMLEAPAEALQLRAAVKPGITGLWQIRNRANNTSISHMLPYDLDYVSSFSLRRDTLILLTTLGVVFRGEGAM